MARYDTYAVPRADLGEAIREYDINAQTFIGLKVLPVRGVQKKAATMSVHTRESLLKTADVEAAKGAAANRIGLEFEDLAYACTKKKLEMPLLDEDKANYASDLELEFETAETLYHKLLMAQEIRIAALIFNTTTWTGASLYTDNSGAAWGTATSAVIAQIAAAKTKVRDNAGVEPDALIIDAVNMDNLLKNDDILARFPGAAVVDERMIRANLAAIFGLEHLLVGKKRYDSAKEGQAFVSASVWGDTYAMVAKISNGSIGRTPGLGRTILWTADTPENVTVDQYREEQTEGEIYRVKQYTDEKVFDKYFGHLMKTK